MWFQHYVGRNRQETAVIANKSTWTLVGNGFINYYIQTRKCN